MPRWKFKPPTNALVTSLSLLSCLVWEPSSISSYLVLILDVLGCINPSGSNRTSLIRPLNYCTTIRTILDQSCWGSIRKTVEFNANINHISNSRRSLVSLVHQCWYFSFILKMMYVNFLRYILNQYIVFQFIPFYTKKLNVLFSENITYVKYVIKRIYLNKTMDETALLLSELLAKKVF